MNGLSLHCNGNHIVVVYALSSDQKEPHKKLIATEEILDTIQEVTK